MGLQDNTKIEYSLIVKSNNPIDSVFLKTMLGVCLERLVADFQFIRGGLIEINLYENGIPCESSKNYLDYHDLILASQNLLEKIENLDDSWFFDEEADALKEAIEKIKGIV